MYLASIEREEGQDLAEYGLLLVFIAIVVIVGVTALGDQVLTIFNQLVTDLGG
jgi:pilus assembly protein Flp/PilA